jgi:hypothetical protein
VVSKGVRAGVGAGVEAEAGLEEVAVVVDGDQIARAVEDPELGVEPDVVVGGDSGVLREVDVEVD